MTVTSGALEALQPNGSWETGPYIVAILAALRLGRVSGAITLAALDAALTVFGVIEHNTAPTVSLILLSTLPWFLMLRLLRRIREKNLALEASQVAEARAAAAAERGHLAREMHDVLAHSLSALALQLESTRLLAHGRGVDEDVTRALNQAHHIAASGLDEARRAIATARGDDVPGPQRLEALVETFGEHSGLPVTLEVHGEQRELAADARLAVYRTAQEALTNIRRHATPERIDVRSTIAPMRPFSSSKTGRLPACRLRRQPPTATAATASPACVSAPRYSTGASSPSRRRTASASSCGSRPGPAPV
jgi:signal transduction histidine kinase